MLNDKIPIVDCGTASLSNITAGSLTELKITFNKSFTVVPVLSVTICCGGYTLFVNEMNVTKTGATIKVWLPTSSSKNTATPVNWIAVGK